MSEPDTQPAPPTRRGRWVRGGLIALAALAVVAATGLWTVTRSWFLVGRIEPALERRLGGPVTVGEALYEGGGRLRLHDVVLRCRGLAGPAGEIARIDGAEITLHVPSLLVGRVDVMGVEIESLRIRLSEDERAGGRFSFMNLEPDLEGDRPRTSALPPYVRLDRVLIETGVHDGTDYSPVGRRWMTGSMAPRLDAPTQLGFRFTETDRIGMRVADEPLEIEGQWDTMTAAYHAVIHGLRFDDRTFDMCPAMLRLWWQRLDVEGEVADATIRWDGREALDVSVDLDDVALTLPRTGDDILWARYDHGVAIAQDEPPRMRVRDGRVRLRRDRLSLENLVGEIRGTGGDGAPMTAVPYEVSLTIRDLPPLDWDRRQSWADEVLRTAPFDMHVRLDRFDLMRGDADALPAVDLPRQVAAFLARFELSDWRLSAEIDAHRDAPGADGAPAPLRTEGHAYLSEARGTFQTFRYPLEEIEAYLEIGTERVRILDLTARGSAGARIQVRGEIEPLDRTAGIRLHLLGEDVPLDDRFRGALDDTQRQIHDELLDRGAFDALAAAGRLPDAASIERDRARLAELEAAGDADPAAVARLRRHVDAGPFELGGTVDLDLRFRRPPGPDESLAMEGTVVLGPGGLIYHRFPYPLRIAGGTLRWFPDRVEITAGDGSGAGAPFTAPGGGRGTIGGTILLPRDDRATSVALDIAIEDDRVTPLVGAAIPVTRYERDAAPPGATWPGTLLARGGRILDGLGLDAVMDCTGHVEAGPDAVDYDFDVTLRGGRATPTPALARTLRLDRLPWPETWSIEDIEGGLQVSPRSVRIDRVRGRRGDGTVETNGRIAFAEDERDELRIDFVDLPIEEDLLSLLPATRRDTFERLWSRYSPSGTFDATVQYGRVGEGPIELAVDVRPSRFDLVVDGLVDQGDVTLVRRAGRLRFDGDRLLVEDMILDATGAGRPYGRFEVHGSVPLGAGAPALAGSWEEGDLSCPLVGNLIAGTGRPEDRTWWDQLRPSGSVRAGFELAGDPLDWSVRIVPDVVTIRPDDEPLSLTFDPEGTFVLTPGGVELDRIEIAHGATILRADGAIGRSADGVSIDLELGFDGDVGGRAARAALPEPARDALDTVQFADDAGSRLDGGRLHLERGTDDAGWRGTFDGTLVTRQASFDAGIDVRELAGAFDIDVAIEPGAPTRWRVDVNDARTVIWDHPIEDLHGTIRPDEPGTSALVEGLRGTLYGGVVTGDARLGLDDDRTWEATVQVAGAAVGPLIGADPGDRAARGDLYAGCSLRGVRGRADLTEGRGMARAVGGLSRVPTVLQVANLLQLTLPLAGELEYGEGEFFIAGRTLILESVLLEGGFGPNAVVQLIGEGTIDLERRTIDARLRSRGGVLVIRDLIGGVGDRITGIQVAGTLAEPEARLVPLPGLAGGVDTAPDTIMRPSGDGLESERP